MTDRLHRDLRIPRHGLLVAFGCALLLTACSGIDQSPMRTGFNNALDNCENITSQDERQTCYQNAMINYKRAYSNYLASKNK